MPQPLPEHVRAALEAGSKIEAIKRLREHSGLGLADAKRAVDAGHIPDGLPTRWERADESADSGDDFFASSDQAPMQPGSAHPNTLANQLAPGQVPPRPTRNVVWTMMVVVCIVLLLATWWLKG
ncbi:hypothetical protein [Ottowia sp.]|uniref:hypothetical protein n=1 Tax=Ottowia sp. TaxID=1898956 RepID=UPI003A89071F